MLKAIVNRLKKKEFRDAFVRSHLTHGLAYQIRALRDQRGWTQEELAGKLGLKQQSGVARMEDPSYGRLSIATLLKLSSVFDVALSVRFLSYRKFLLEREDVSPSALSAESFEVEMPRIIEDMERVDHCRFLKLEPISVSTSYLQQSNNLVTSGTTGYPISTDVSAGVN